MRTVLVIPAVTDTRTFLKGSSGVYDLLVHSGAGQIWWSSERTAASHGSALSGFEVAPPVHAGVAACSGRSRSAYEFRASTLLSILALRCRLQDGSWEAGMNSF